MDTIYSFVFSRMLVLIGLMLMLVSGIEAQTVSQDRQDIDIISLGLGIGLDYGGFGVNALYCPHENLGLYAGLGYALAGTGVNAGMKLRFVPRTQKTRLSGFGLLMYGYNAAIVVMDDSEHNKLFYGPSAGVGIDYRRKHAGKGYWSFALLLPFRNASVGEYMDELETKHNIQFENELIPVGVSIGYRFVIQ